MIFKRSALAKRVISFALSFMMVVSMICALPLGSSAASYSYLFPVKNGVIAYGYGYSESYGGWHAGVDIHSNGDDTIYAAFSGVVGAVADSCGHVSCGYACEHYSMYTP